MVETHIAEPADFVVRLALGVKVASTLATSHHETSERVLERLLKAEELQDREVDRGMESEAALVGAECRVELCIRQTTLVVVRRSREQLF